MPKLIRKNLGWFLSGVLISLFVGFCFVNIFSTEAQEQIKIFPTVFDGDWQNPEAAFSQDLGENATFIEFNIVNSAYPLEIPEFPIEETATPPQEGIVFSGERSLELSDFSVGEAATPPQEGIVFSGERSLELSDFSVGEEFKENKINIVQLRFSLAGKGEAGDRLIIGYFYLARQSFAEQNLGGWQSLAEFDLENEISNNLNGGYFLYGLPVFENWEDLENFKIKFVYQGQENAEVFLDSLWLEITTEEQPQELIEEQPQQEEQPRQIGERRHFKSNEEPEFELEESFFAKIKSLFGKDKREIVLINPEGREKWEGWIIQGNKIKILRPGDERSFKAGLYKLKIEQGGEEIIQEFTWGVLAINTNKSIYLPNETAYLQMAALRDDGHTICDANLKLEITTPDGSVLNPTVQKSGECGPNNVTDVPDYFAYYQIGDTGLYRIKLTNLDNGYEISDSFEVRESVPFDIERIGSTRIYPPATYEMSLKIKANQDFVGEIKEMVPVGFAVSGEDIVRQEVEGQEKIILWQVDWKAGESYELKYQFDAPDISPYLYLLGPLKIGDFQENRQWQIASDAPGNRTKTVEFFVGQYYGTGIASTTVTNYDFTVYLPDAISSATVVRSAYIEYNALIGATDASATDFQLGEVGSLTSLSAPDVIDQAGESTPVGMKLDATAKLQSIIQAAGTFNLRFSTAITGPIHYGESARLKITYDYDDTAATQLKTVYAWVHSQAATVASGGSVTSANFNLGLPESTITSRSTWIETRGYVNAALNVGFYWNAETERDITWNNTNNSYGYVALVSPTTTYSPNTDNTFTIKSVSGAFSAPSAILGYTYSFDYPASTELMNSLQILLYQGTETASTETLTGDKVINIPEASITMKSCFLGGRAVRTAVGTLGMNAQLGSTPGTTGISILANAGETSGFTTIVWDVTSNLSSMANGDNTVYWAYSASAATNIRGLVLYLNYKYNKASTTTFNFQAEYHVGQQTAASTTWSQAFTPSIADTTYTLKQSFLNHQINENATTALAATIGISTTGTYTFLSSGENVMGEVWRDTSSDVSALGSELTATLDNSRSSTKSASFLVWWQASVITNQPPTVDSVVISPSPTITLEPDSTKTVTITAIITDNDGCEDVFVSGLITGVFFDDAAEDDTCIQDDNDCYTSLTFTEVDDTCTGPGDYTAEASTTISEISEPDGVWFIANPSSSWTAKVTATDSQSQSASNTQTVTINQLLALEVIGGPISYGTVYPDENTGEINQQVTVYNIGNIPCDVRLSGTDITWSGDNIDASNQKYSLSEFNYNSGGTPLKEYPDYYDDINVDLPKPTTHSPSNSSVIFYWGLGVPSPMPASAPPHYQGTNYFEVINALP